MSKPLIDKEIIDNYLYNKLDKEARYALEKQSLNDPFIFDAIEGLENFATSDEDIKILNATIQNRIAKSKSKSWYYQQWGIAASVILLIAAGTIFYNQYQESKPIALNELQKANAENSEISSTNENTLDNQNNQSLTEVSKATKEISIGNKVATQQTESNLQISDSTENIASLQNEGVMADQTMASRTSAPQAKTVNGVQAIALQDLLSNLISTPIPLNELLDFQNHVEINSKIDDNYIGKVILLFQVDTDGYIKNIKVLDSVSKLADERAINIVKNFHQFRKTKLDTPLWITAEINFKNP